MKRVIQDLLFWTVVLAVVYVMYALSVYRFNHPWLTETQLFQAIPKALMLVK